MSRHVEVGNQIGQLLDVKQLAYGNSFGEAHKIMAVLYPNGITVEQMPDALTIIRIQDKLFRIAQKQNTKDKDKMQESPYRDIAGYAILAVVRDEEVEDSDEQAQTD